MSRLLIAMFWPRAPPGKRRDRDMLLADRDVTPYGPACRRAGRHPCPQALNPHLFVSRVRATETVPVSYNYLSRWFIPAGITAARLREDRMDEARHTADPVRLMRFFGVSDGTAMKYVFTAHPDRQSVPGRVRGSTVTGLPWQWPAHAGSGVAVRHEFAGRETDPACGTRCGP